MRLDWQIVLYVAVVFVGLNVAFYWLRSALFSPQRGARAHESERNERSTPRNFILPATPAVAFEQEMRARKNSLIAKNERQLARCAARLLDLGYDVGDEAVAFNAKLAESIFEYQKTHGLRPTGRLDPTTITKLSCRE